MQKMIKNFEFLINDFLTLNLYTLNATNFHKMKILRKNIWSFKKNCREITNYVKKYWKLLQILTVLQLFSF